jgi:hypothetical protein
MMAHREDLIPRFEWLAGSKYYDEALDEALVAIAFTAHGRGTELVEYGAAWMMANGVVEVFGLEDLVERARKELLPFLRE